MQIAGTREPASEIRGEPSVQIGLACERGIQWLKLSGRLGQECGSVAARGGGEYHLPAHQADAGLLELVQRPRRRHGEQLAGRIQRAGLQVRLRGRQGPLSPPSGFGRQLGGALQERRRRSHPAAGLRPARRPLQLVGHLLIGSRRRRGQMPRPPIRISVAIGHLGQRPVRRPPVRQRRGGVHRRPHQRMPEPHPRPDLQQPVRLGGLRRRSRDPEPPGRPPHQHRVPGRLRRRDQHQRPRVGGQRLQPLPEALLDPGRDRPSPRQPEPAGQLREAQPARQLQQGQRVTRRLGQDPVPDLLIEPDPDRRI